MNPLTRPDSRRAAAARLACRLIVSAMLVVVLPTQASADRRFFRPAQSSVPAPTFAPNQPSAPPLAPAEPGPTLADDPGTVAPLTDAPPFLPPAIPTLKTPALPPEAPVLQTPAPPHASRTITSLRPDGSACMVLDVTAEYVNRLIGMPRQEAGPVNDIILGARVEGEQRTQTRVWIQTFPSAGTARFDVALDGESCSRTTARTPQAAIQTEGRQKFDVRKPVEFDGGLLTTRTPGALLDTCQRHLRARTGASQIPVVNSIAETIALNQANLRQPLARQETARRVTSQVVPRFNQAIDERLAAANQWLGDLSTRAPGVHAFLTSGRWSSTETSISGQIPSVAPVDRPAPPPRGGATIRLHESFAPSIATALKLPGREVAVEEIRGWIGVFNADVSGRSGESSLPLAAPSDASLRLADQDPLSLRLEGDAIRVVLRASIRAGDGIELPVHRITIGYSIRHSGDSIELQPLPVAVEAEGEGTLVGGAVEQLIQSQIEARLEPLTISPTMIPPMPNGMRPRVSDVMAADGWLTVVFE